MEYLEPNKERLSRIKKLLFTDIWRNEQLNQEQKELLKDLIQNNYIKLYGRKINGTIINIGLNNPSTHELGDQTLMFGPAGNFPECPEIIISGISTSVTAANGIAESLKKKDIESLNANDVREIYLNNIYKGEMYKKFKRKWEARSKESIYEKDFLDLFDMIEGKKIIGKDSKIMVT
ncbi:MAG: hypothetical protein KKI06_14675, partial [Euryarchaeota archaeon]|nr:hypothetical protein [Euryarchaeota archaeon]